MKRFGIRLLPDPTRMLLGFHWKFSDETWSYDCQEANEGYGHQCYGIRRLDVWVYPLPCVGVQFGALLEPFKLHTLKRKFWTD